MAYMCQKWNIYKGTHLIICMLEYVFNSKPKAAILRLLATRDDWIFSLSEISRELRIPKNTVKRSIRPLVEYNILREFKKGKSTVFQLNLRNYIVKQMIVPLFQKEYDYPFNKASEFCIALAKEIKKTNNFLRKEVQVSAMILFGSLADDEMTPTSDIDIAVISENSEIIEANAEALKSKYLKDEGLLFSVHVFKPEDFKKRYKKKDPLIVNIVNGVTLYGDIDKVI